MEPEKYDMTTVGGRQAALIDALGRWEAAARVASRLGLEARLARSRALLASSAKNAEGREAEAVIASAAQVEGAEQAEVGATSWRRMLDFIVATSRLPERIAASDRMDPLPPDTEFDLPE
jgi:hypothetical protein